jgi:hypothetical protein
MTEQIDAYRRVAKSDVLTPDVLLQLLTMHDGDNMCFGACARHVSDYIGPSGEITLSRCRS